ncbi:hypothetical protein H5410_037337 [Solanum commersonii]|uniref:Uncharacterized protein n=1 Tax=Solanum commersonii TaxID=4109 RepID=A0A9J5Y6U5_SOLCO|nr:hypothetical protein H5410_037337 [Solanum commersonii]
MNCLKFLLGPQPGIGRSTSLIHDRLQYLVIQFLHRLCCKTMIQKEIKSNHSKPNRRQLSPVTLLSAVPASVENEALSITEHF